MTNKSKCIGTKFIVIGETDHVIGGNDNTTNCQKKMENGLAAVRNCNNPDNGYNIYNTAEIDEIIARRRTTNYGPNESRRILKNLHVLGFSFTLLFSAYLATANLQSSINSEDNVGMYALIGLYITMLSSALILPSLVMYKCKIKMTMVGSILGYMSYIAAQFHPTFMVLIPCGIYIGLCGAHLWAAASAYLAKIAEEYTFLQNKGTTSAAVLQHFFGIFFVWFHSSQIWGNLISSTVLSSVSQQVSNLTSSSGNETATGTAFGHCGPNFCLVSRVEAEISALDNLTRADNISNLSHPNEAKIYLLFGIFLGCATVAGFIIFFFVDSLIRYGELELKTESKPKITGLLIATVEHWKKSSQLLLIPMSVWVGIQEAFIGADFTMAFISCAWGVEYIGYVMMCFGIFASSSSLLFGKIMPLIGRPTIFLVAGLLDLCCLLILLFWTPDPARYGVFFVVSGLWGLSDGVWSAQVRALYGAIFPNTVEAAFSNQVLWLSIGFVIVYVLNGSLCMSLKLYIYIGTLLVSMICYGLVEIIEGRKSDKGLNTKEPPK